MNGWKTVSLGELVEPAQTWNPSQTPGEIFSYIDLSAVEHGTKRIVDARELKGSEAPSRARQLVAKGDVLVSTVRPNLNGVAVVPPELDGATASTGFCVLRARPTLLDNRYLFQWVKSPWFVSDMVRKATGASYPAVSDRIVFESNLPVPPLEEQKRIADVLDRAEVLRATRSAALTHLDTLIQSIFFDLFGDPATNPKGMRKLPLGQLVKLKSGEFLPGTEMAKSGEFPVMGGNGITGYHDKYMFESPQIIVGRVGVYCGCVHVSPPKSWVTDNALYVSERNADVEFDYLVYAMTYANLNRYASQFGQPLVSGARIYPVEILVPPLTLQLEFARRVATIENLKATYGASLAGMGVLFTALQYRAFRGEL